MKIIRDILSIFKGHDKPDEKGLMKNQNLGVLHRISKQDQEEERQKPSPGFSKFTRNQIADIQKLLSTLPVYDFTLPGYLFPQVASGVGCMDDFLRFLDGILIKQHKWFFIDPDNYIRHVEIRDRDHRFSKYIKYNPDEFTSFIKTKSVEDPITVVFPAGGSWAYERIEIYVTRKGEDIFWWRELIDTSERNR